ncbi:MAG: GNAT family N-acetyltransferase, partial [Inquilinus sp.]|nr:GNAT family N-acetyltransferase [Inquilinus sp.]
SPLAPRGETSGWAASIDQLAGYFAAHGRALRLEFFHELHPSLATALESAGIGLDKPASAMALAPGELRVPQPTALTLSPLTPGNAIGVRRFLAVQSEAFGVRIDSGPTGWRPILEAGLADNTMVAAIGEVGGHACCGAVLMIGGGAAELAGVGTLPAYRRHGYAADLCARLLTGHFDRSADPVWLSADDDIAAGLYGELGFETVGTQLNYGRRGAKVG